MVKNVLKIKIVPRKSDRLRSSNWHFPQMALRRLGLKSTNYRYNEIMALLCKTYFWKLVFFGKISVPYTCAVLYHTLVTSVLDPLNLFVTETITYLARILKSAISQINSELNQLDGTANDCFLEKL